MEGDLKPARWCGVLISGYYVGPDGRVWSEKTSKYLKPYAIGKGYRAVSVRHEGRSVEVYVHRLVFESWYGVNPGSLDVCHNDGVRDNNRPDNLRADTRSANLADRAAHGTDQRGERNPAAKLSDAAVKEIRERRASGEKLREIAARFGVRESCVSRICNRKRRD